MRTARRIVSVFLLLIWIALSGCALAAGEDRDALFDAALAALQSPAEIGISSKAYALHPGESAYVPSVAPEVTPFDAETPAPRPAVQGSFDSSDEAVVTVDAEGLMTAISEGSAIVTYRASAGDEVYEITVSADVPTEIAKNMAYVAQREFFQVKQKRLPKYNDYAKWYYGKKKEVGWCSVFGVWCANAAGGNPIRETASGDTPDTATLYLWEGQVGNQYDGFFALGRFGSIPRVGYMVIYAEMDNLYRTTHIGIVVGVEDLGGGIYEITTVEGNMSSSVKSYRYRYDSNLTNHAATAEKNRKLNWNMIMVPEAEQTDPLVQYELHTDHWSVFGFCETWK